MGTQPLVQNLLELGVLPGNRILVRGGRSVSTVIAILGVLRAGATYCIVSSRTPSTRWETIRRELAPAAIIETDTTSQFEDGGVPIVATPRPLDMTELAPLAPWPPSVPAYVIFTSGSTGVPKGVVVGHDSVLAMVASFEELAPITGRLNGFWLARPEFDVSVWEVFSVLTQGGTLHIPSPRAEADGESLWREMVSRRITSAYIPPGLIAPIVEAAQSHTGVAAPLERLLVGVEPIPGELLGRLVRAVPDLRVINGYGPTEATICATLHVFSGEVDESRRTPIGKAVRGSTVTLVDGDLEPVPPGVTGEILVEGRCLALGYLRSEDEVGRFLDGPSGRVYRTGDLARELSGGVLEFVGRTDDQVKVNGVRIEPGEIENALSMAPLVRRSIVLVQGKGGDSRLIGYVEGDPRPSTGQVLAHIETLLPPHLMPARIRSVREFPTTANGKVDAVALLAMDASRSSEDIGYVAPTTVVERSLANVAADSLGLEFVGIDDDLIALGASSLDIKRLCVVLRELGWDCTPSEVMRLRTVRQLSDAADTGALRQLSHLAPTEPGTYPTTRGQQGLWAWRELHPESCDTTLVHSIGLGPSWDRVNVERALRAVVGRQEALRTIFRAGQDGRPMRTVLQSGNVELTTRNLVNESAVLERIYELRDLRLDVRDRSWCAELLITTSTATLVIVADHLIMDGESVSIFERELEDSLRDIEGGREPQDDPLPGPVGTSQLDSAESDRYWGKVLEQSGGVSALPATALLNPGPRRNAELRQHLSTSVWEKVCYLARDKSTTPIVIVLAVLERLLSRRSGGSALVCLAVSQRIELSLDSAIGNAVNIVPISIEGNSGTFAEHLETVRRSVVSAVEHAATPFEDMIAGDTGRPPIPSLVLAQHVRSPSQRHSSGARQGRPISRSVHEVAVFLEEPRDGESAVVDWAWDASVTFPEAVPHLSSLFAESLEMLTAEPDTPLRKIKYLSVAEEQLIDYAAQVNDVSDPRTVIDLYDEQLREHPNSVAVRWRGECFTFAELDVRAEMLGSLLARELEGDPAGVIAVVLEKGLDLVAALIAVLRSGGAYLPLDPTHAATRLPDLVARGFVKVCLTESSLLADAPPGLRVIRVGGATDERLVPTSSTASVDPGDLAYVMPTSGSTGTPRLVGVPHRAVTRLVTGNSAFPLHSADRTLLAANISFDAATFELWGSLCNGGSVVIPQPEDLRDATRLCRLVENEGVTAAFFTVTLFARLLDAEPQRLRGVRLLLVGGEPVPPKLAERALRILGPNVLLNGYGPTENTTFSCSYPVRSSVEHLRSLPLGRAIDGSGVLILDEQLEPLPVGVTGEIVVTGSGLAIGYIDDPELTAKRFVTLPEGRSERAYRTGDLGRLLPSGDVEYLGRIDRQVKIRGFRVEPAEVEVALESHPSVSRATVFAEEASHETRLLAAVEAVAIEGAELRAWSRSVLPPFLVPDRIVVVDQFPATANGKLDTRSIVHMSRQFGTRPAISGSVIPRGYISSDLGAQVLEVWRGALSIAELGPEEDVFDAGASSMTVLTVAARLSEVLGRRVAAHIVHSCRTPESLVTHLRTELQERIQESVMGPEREARRARAHARAARVRRLSDRDGDAGT